MGDNNPAAPADADRPLEELSVKELKDMIRRAGLSSGGITEKAELRERAVEARARLAEAAASVPSPAPHEKKPGLSSLPRGSQKTLPHPWRPRYEYFNGASESKKDAELAVILMHGIGATRDDLVPLGGALASRLSSGTRVLFVFPGAPDGAWWPLDPTTWMTQAMGGDNALARMIRTEYPGLAACRDVGATLIADVRKVIKPDAKVILGGFSQGAMTSTDVALHLQPDAAVDGVLHLSGAPLVVDAWNSRLRSHLADRKPRVYISHGRQDFLLPFVVSGWTKQLFENAGCDVSYAPHNGAHDVGPFEPIVDFLTRVMSSSSTPPGA